MVQWLRALALAGPGLDFQHLYDASQPPVAPVLGDLMLSSDSLGHQTHMLHRCTCRAKHPWFSLPWRLPG